MSQSFKNRSQFIHSKWFVLAIDFGIVLIFSFVFQILGFLTGSFVWLPAVIFSLSSIATKLNIAIVNRTGINDIIILFKTGLLALVLTQIIEFVYQANPDLIFPYILLFCSFSVFMILYRVISSSFTSKGKKGKNENVYWIYGAGTAGQLTYTALKTKVRVEGFIDDDSSVQNKTIDGLKVYSFNSACDRMDEDLDHEIIVAIQNISPFDKSEIVESFIEKNISVKVVPAIEDWAKGRLTVSQIQPINVAQLLGRREINLDLDHLKKQLEGKTVLVTGGAGSIGAEIVKQIAYYAPKKILIIDQAETPIFELYHLPQQGNLSTVFEAHIGSVTDEKFLNEIFRTHNIDLVYHAAAYKHVPVMESNPLAAVRTNIFGTALLAQKADEFKVSKFLFISTDKAVRPTNVMGATKRAAEIFIQSMNEKSKTSFITTRFGNVLGSSGSVIPIFKKQIENGGPVRVTHKDINRFFMTIPEACQLVLEACSIGKGGEVFVFDMGKSIKIYDLAVKMIHLSGLEVGKDIDIEITGLRPGEKLYEELITESEQSIDTHHPKIMISKVNPVAFDEVAIFMNKLTDQMNSANSKTDIIKSIKEFVPDYKSNNSVFVALDK